MGNFKIIAKQGQARAGVLKTLHGEIETPVYMPVGTQGTVKALTPDDLKTLGAQIVLGNTYHLNLRPTSELIKKMGGLHEFMKWDGPILTDSGGFQAFSLGAMIEHGIKKVSQAQSVNHESRISELAKSYMNQGKIKVRKSGKVYDTKQKTISRHVTVEVIKPASKGLVKITEDGVEFKSHLDGAVHMLTPERSIQIQINIGADIILVLDELISPLHSKSYVAQSLERTHRWELRSLKYYKTSVKKSREKRGMIFGILQGVDDKTIRQQEARWIAKQDFDGVSIGGSFGTSPLWSESEEKEIDDTNWASTKSIEKTMAWVTPLLPDSWPRHALGIGEVVDLFLCVEKGVDMFDCVSPTRRARNGSLYISPKNGGKIANKFVVNIGNAEFALDLKPIDPGCECYTCQNFSRGYLRHLFIARELLYFRLASIHNLYFMVNLVKKIREAIINKQFKKLKKNWLE